MLRQERFHAERYFFTLFLHPTQELKTIWNRLQNLKYSGPVHTWPISKLMTSLRPFLPSSKGKFWFCPRCLWCPRRVSQSHRPRTAARSKCWARWFSLLCQTCLSQTQLIPIKLISSYLYQLLYIKLICAKLVVYTKPLFGLAFCWRWRLGTVVLAPLSLGRRSASCLDWFAVVALCLGALASDRPCRSAGKKCL